VFSNECENTSRLPQKTSTCVKPLPASQTLYISCLDEYVGQLQRRLVKPLHIHISTTQKHYYSSFLKSTAYFFLFFCFELPWVPEDIFFHLVDTDRSRGSRVNEERSAERKKYPSREPSQTVSTVYFILGILRTELQSQGSFE